MHVDAASMGKNAGDDFIDQKITLPVILAWQDASAEERGFWQRTLGEANFRDGDLDTAQAILTCHDAIARSIGVARDYVARACDAIAPFGNEPQNATLVSALIDAARFAAHRDS